MLHRLNTLLLLLVTVLAVGLTQATIRQAQAIEFTDGDGYCPAIMGTANCPDGYSVAYIMDVGNECHLEWVSTSSYFSYIGYWTCCQYRRRSTICFTTHPRFQGSASSAAYLMYQRGFDDPAYNGQCTPNAIGDPWALDCQYTSKEGNAVTLG